MTCLSIIGIRFWTRNEGSMKKAGDTINALNGRIGFLELQNVKMNEAIKNDVNVVDLAGGDARGGAGCYGDLGTLSVWLIYLGIMDMYR